jgi:hypothetical protein
MSTCYYVCRVSYSPIYNDKKTNIIKKIEYELERADVKHVAGMYGQWNKLRVAIITVKQIFLTFYLVMTCLSLNSKIKSYNLAGKL